MSGTHDETATTESRGEWRVGWKVVLAAFFGTSVAAVEPRAMAVLMKPLTQEHGWSRAEVSVAPLLFSLATLFMAPVVGMLADRFGARRIVLAGIPLFALSISLIGAAGGNLVLFYALYLLTAMVASTSGTIPWAHGVASRFRRHRGLALGVAMSGISAVGSFVPLIADVMLRKVGLALTWSAIGLYAFVVAFPLAVLFFFPAGTAGAQSGQGVRASTDAQSGFEFGEALRASRFWRLALAMTLTMGVLGIYHNHNIALLTDQGIDPTTAAIAYGMMGPGTMLGRLLGGWLLDRFEGPWAAAATLFFPIAGCVLLLAPGHPLWVMFGIAMAMGFATGMEGDTVAYLSTRYFGMRHYGKIYGLLFGLSVVGGGAGSFLAGLSFDMTGSYDLVLWCAIAALLAGVVLFVTLGRYPDVREEPRATAQ